MATKKKSVAKTELDKKEQPEVSEQTPAKLVLQVEGQEEQTIIEAPVGVMNFILAQVGIAIEAVKYRQIAAQCGSGQQLPPKEEEVEEESNG